MPLGKERKGRYVWGRVVKMRSESGNEKFVFEIVKETKGKFD